MIPVDEETDSDKRLSMVDEALVAGTIANTTTVTATVAGRPATVVSSVASPGFAGLYQVAVTIPAGVTGNAAIQLTQNSVRSNSVEIPVQ